MKRFNLVFSLFLYFLAISSLPAQKKIVLTTYNASITDASIALIAPDINWGKEPNLWPYAWTQGGVVNIVRPLLRFDLSGIPAGAIVDEALLVLHYDPTTHEFGLHSGNTAFSISRIIEPWDELGVVWNNQPATSTEHQVVVPPFGFDQQNYVVNVTQLIRDMLDASSPGNFGFMFQLLDENPYNVVRLAGTDHADVSRHPQLWLSIDDGYLNAGDEEKTIAAAQFSVGPNPTSGEVIVSSKVIPHGTNTIEVYDLAGTRLFSQILAGSFSYLYLQHLPAGTYVLKIFNDDSGYIQEAKIVLMK